MSTLFETIKSANNYFTDTLSLYLNLNYNNQLYSDKKLYTKILLDELTSIESNIWNIFENIEFEVKSSLPCLKDNYDSLICHDISIVNFTSTLTEIDTLIPSIHEKYKKTNRLRYFRSLKLLLLTNLKPLLYINHWDYTIGPADDTINSYFSIKDSIQAEESVFFSDSTHRFHIDTLRSAKDTLAKLKNDYNSILASIKQYNNINITLNIVIEKYYSILKDLILDIIKFIVVKNNRIYEFCKEINLTFNDFITFVVDCYILGFEEDVYLIYLLDDLKNSYCISIIDVAVNRNRHGDIEHNKLALTERDTSTIEQDLFVSTFADLVDVLVQCNDLLIDFLNIIRYRFNDLDTEGFLKELIIYTFESLINRFALFDISDEFSLNIIEKSNKLLNDTFLLYFHQINLLKISKNLVELNIYSYDLLDRYTYLAYTRSTSIEIGYVIDQNYDNLIQCVETFTLFYNSLYRIYNDMNFKISNNQCLIGIGIDWLYIVFFVYKINKEYDLITNNISNYISKHLLTIDPYSLTSNETENSLREIILSLLNNDSKLIKLIKDFLMLNNYSNNYIVTQIIYNRFKIKSEWEFTSKVPQSYYEAIQSDIYCLSLVDEFKSGVSLINTVSMLTSNFISKRGIDLLSGSNSSLQLYYNNTLDNYVSIPLQKLGEYFISLIPLYSDHKIRCYNILESSFTTVINDILPTIIQSRPIDRTLLEYYRMDIEYLIKISDICNVENKGSLETILLSCDI